MKKNQNQENKVVKTSGDAGNNSIKVVMENGVEEIKYNYPNVFIGSNKEYSFEVDEMLKNTEEVKRHLDVTVQLPNDRRGKRVIFGESLTIANDTNVQQRTMGDRKSEDKQLARNIVTAFMATKIGTMSLAEFQKAESIDLEVAVGLPINEYKNPECRASLKRMLLGETKIEFHYPSIRKIREEITINIKNVNVEVEGLAALDIALASSSLEEKILNTKNLNRVFVMADIGNHTVDVIAIKVIEDEGEVTYMLDTDMSEGFLGSVQGALEKVRKRIEKEKGIVPVNGKQSMPLTEITKAYSEKDGMLSSFDINIKSIYEDEMDALGIQIGEEITGLFNNKSTGRIDTIFLTGGGSLIEPIITGFKDEIGDSPVYRDVKIEKFDEIDPIFANSYGYYIALN